MSDRITPISFDNAVVTFGLWVEARLMERDDLTHLPKYTLYELLGTEAESENERLRRNSEMFAMFKGSVRRKVANAVIAGGV